MLLQRYDKDGGRRNNEGVGKTVRQKRRDQTVCVGVRKGPAGLWYEDVLGYTQAMDQQPNQPHIALPAATGDLGVLPGVRSLLQQTWVIYQQRYRLFLGILLVPLMLASVASLTIPTVKNDAVLFVSLALLSLLNFFFSVTGDIALLYAIRDREQGATFTRAYGDAFRNFGPLVWVAVLYACVVTGGSALFLIPGVFLSVTLGFSMYAAVNENLRGFAPLFRSRAYVRGRWSQVFLRILFLILLLIPIYIVLFLVQEFAGNAWVYDALNFLVSLFVIPFTTLYTYALYTAVKQLYERSGAPEPAVPHTSYRLLAIFGALVIVALFLLPFFLPPSTLPAI